MHDDRGPDRIRTWRQRCHHQLPMLRRACRHGQAGRPLRPRPNALFGIQQSRLRLQAHAKRKSLIPNCRIFPIGCRLPRTPKSLRFRRRRVIYKFIQIKNIQEIPWKPQRSPRKRNYRCRNDEQLCGWLQRNPQWRQIDPIPSGDACHLRGPAGPYFWLYEKWRFCANCRLIPNMVG